MENASGLGIRPRTYRRSAPPVLADVRGHRRGRAISLRPARLQACVAVRLFTAMLVTVLVVAGVTVGGYALFDSQNADTGGTVEVEGGDQDPGDGRGLPAGAARISGTVMLVHAEPAELDPVPMPLEIVTRERSASAGASFEGVTIEGAPGSIAWDAGRPLEIEGDGGALALDPIVVDVTTDGIVVSLDGTHGFVAGSYEITTLVAVGTAGIAEPVDSVTFEAAEGATVTFRGGATTTLATRPLTMRGPGAVVLQGALAVETASGTTEAARVDFASAPFEITLTPTEGGYAIDAILQGSVLTS